MIKLLYEITGNLQLSIIVSLIFYSLAAFDIWYFYNCIKKHKFRLNFVMTAIAFATGVLLGATTSLSLATIGIIGAAVGIIGGMCVYGGLALALSNKNTSDYGSSSSTYANPTLQTQTNPDLPLPMLYGKEGVKLAGNRIWQDSDSSTTIKRIVAFAEGEIEDFTDIRLNDIPISEISGITVNKYYGTDTQEIDSIVPGNTHEERCEVVGSLRNVAYLAITVPVSSDIDYNYNLTAVVKGRKIRVYTDEDTYTTECSSNPAWVMLDFLTAYNGIGLGLNNDGTKNDTTIKSIFDINSYIESADFCDEILTDTLSGTVSTSGTTVTGVDTAFKTEVLIGDIISIEGEDRTVTVITDDEHLTVNSAFTTMSNKTYSEKQPRFAFNMIFDSQTSARDLIDEIQRNCRGGLFSQNGKLQFKIDKAEDISKVFTKDDIITGSEIFQTIPREEQYEILRLSFISPGYEWQKIEAFAELSEYRDGAPIEHSANAYSVNRFKQASRLSNYYLLAKKLCPHFGEFKTDYRAYDLETGDVIQHYSPLMDATLISKVISVKNDGAGVFTVSWRNYDADLYSDALGSKQPKVLISNLSDVYAYPSDISSFSVIQNQKLIEFAWTEVQGLNITYEIREGSSWTSSRLVANNLTGTTYTANLTQKGTFTYWIKAKNKYQVSENATSDILNVQYIPEMNEIITQNILENASGTHTNTYIYNNVLKLKPTGKWQNKSPEKWENSGDRYYADDNGKWGAKVATSGQYVSQIFDIGANLSNVVSFNKSEYLTDNQQSFTYEWRYSEDGETYSDWALCNTGAYQFRYHQERITINNPNGAQMNLSNFVVAIDVPDRTETYTNREITTAADGVTITYATDSESKIASSFIKAKPHVLATPLNNAAIQYVTNDNANSCTVKLKDTSGNLITGNVNITVSGY